MGRRLTKYENPVVQGRVNWLRRMGIRRDKIITNQLDRPMSNLAYIVLRNRVVKF